MGPGNGERSPPRSARYRRLRVRLVAFIFCAIFLTADLLWLASEYPNNSRLTQTVSRVLGWQTRRSGTHPWLHIHVAHTHSGPAFAFPPLLPESAKGVPSATFTLWPPSPPSGLWAPTRRGRIRGMYYEHTPGATTLQLPPVELREPIRAFIASTFEPGRLEQYDELIASGGSGTSPLLLGYIHNAVALAAAIMMLACSGSLLIDLVRHLRERRFPHGHCGRCGYDLSGLAPDSACPECSAVWRSEP